MTPPRPGHRGLALVLVMLALLVTASALPATVTAQERTSIEVEICTYQDAPLTILPDDGPPTGVYGDVLAIIAEHRNWTINWTELTFPACLENITTGGSFDMMTGIAHTEDREAIMAFPNEAIFLVWGQIHTREDEVLTSITELEGLRIAVLRDDVLTQGPDGLFRLLNQFEINATFVEYDSHLAGLEALDRGDVDAAVAGRFTGEEVTRLDVVPTSIAFSPVSLTVSMPLNATLNTRLIADIDEVLEPMKRDPDSPYHLALERHFGLATATSTETVETLPEWVWPAVISGSVILLGAIAALLTISSSLRRAKAAEAKSRAIFESMDDAVVIHVPGQPYHEANDAAGRLLGVARGDVLGLDARELDVRGPEAVDATIATLQRNRSTVFETRLKRANDTLVDVEVHATRLEGTGEPRILSVIRDIRQRKAYEAGLVEASEAAELARSAAEEANIAKSSFLASMSHELRTPMNAIIGFTEILADGAFGELNDKQAKYVGNILGSAQHLLSLINDILDLSKIEAGKMEIHTESMDLGMHLFSVFESLQPLAFRKSIQLELDLEKDLPLVEADPQRIKQIATNLLSNAIKFTPEEGRITIGARSLTPDDPEHEVEVPMIEVSVTDTGIGIASEDLERVFRRFEQIDSGYARQQEGTGLGLNLTRELVEMHGGTLHVDSPGPGLGSTFSFRLPVPARTQET